MLAMHSWQHESDPSGTTWKLNEGTYSIKSSSILYTEDLGPLLRWNQPASQWPLTVMTMIIGAAWLALLSSFSIPYLPRSGKWNPCISLHPLFKSSFLSPAQWELCHGSEGSWNPMCPHTCRLLAPAPFGSWVCQVSFKHQPAHEFHPIIPFKLSKSRQTPILTSMPTLLGRLWQRGSKLLVLTMHEKLLSCSEL